MGVTKMPDDYVKRSDVHKVFQPKYAPAINRTFAAMIDSVPAADVVEVRRASWMAENSRPKSGIFYCSCCHRTCYDPQPTRAKGWTKRCRYHYCPNCGAKMDGGQDE